MKLFRRSARPILAAVIAIAALGISAETASAHTQSSCPTGSGCLGRAGYTVETSGNLMYGFTLSDYTYVNLPNFAYETGLNMNDKSWRIRNRLASNRKMCVYTNIDYSSILYVEIYSSTIKWNAALPDDQASSVMFVASNANCP